MSVSAVLSRIAPHFDSHADRDGFIADAEAQTSRCFYGNNADRAVALRAAHMMQMADRLTGEGGPVTDKKEGDLEQSFAVNNKTGDADLNQTSYGVQLQGLMNSSNLHIGVTGPYGRQC